MTTDTRKTDRHVRTGINILLTLPVTKFHCWYYTTLTSPTSHILSYSSAALAGTSNSSILQHESKHYGFELVCYVSCITSTALTHLMRGLLNLLHIFVKYAIHNTANIQSSNLHSHVHELMHFLYLAAFSKAIAAVSGTPSSK